MNNKPELSEEEMNEIDSLNMRVGKEFRTAEIIEFLKKKFNYSDVNVHIIEIRKEFHKRDAELQQENEKRFPNSTLQNTLLKRIDWTDQNKKEKA